MTTLHIEHPITDLSTWLTAYGRFSEARRAAGVLAESVRQPLDDDRFVVIDLEFSTDEQANAFLGFLRSQVWAVPENSPALAGSPVARLLRSVEAGTSIGARAVRAEDRPLMGELTGSSS